MDLQEQGFRFVYVAGEQAGYQWMHPSILPSDAIDCTDMNDDEFEAFVRAHS